MVLLFYQSSGIGAIDAEDGHGGLDLAGSRGGEGSDGDGDAEGSGALGSSGPDGADDLSREHGGQVKVDGIGGGVQGSDGVSGRRSSITWRLLLLGNFRALDAWAGVRHPLSIT